MRLSDKERYVLRKLDFMSKRGDDHCTIEAFLGYAGAPKNERQAMAYTLRNLGKKLERERVKLRRVSKLGRGRKGVYEFGGDFAGVLAKENPQPEGQGQVGQEEGA